jgi:hypothetical protein
MTAQKKTTKPTRREAADETTSSERLTALVPLHRDYDSLSGPMRSTREPKACTNQPVKIAVQGY